MKIKCFLFGALTLFVLKVSSQNLLNKVKSKASQEVNKEVNKLEQGAASNPSTNTRNKLSSNVTRTVAVSLREGESFDYNESCIDLGTSLSQLSFIVNNSLGDRRQCFSYRNGTRTAVACPSNSDCGTSPACSYNKLRLIDLGSDEAKKYIVNETESHQVAQPAISDQQLKMMSTYMTKEQMDQMKKQLADAQKQTANQTYSTVKSRTIKFNGKTYGPYTQLSQFYLSADNNNFYATIIESDQAKNYSYKIITSSSAASIVIPGMMPPMSCVASGDNSEFAAVAANNEGRYRVLTSKGKTIEIPDMTYFQGAWYSLTGSHLMMLSKNSLTYDGQVIKTFEGNDSVDPCNLYVAVDGKGVTSIRDNIISFADGDHFEYPLKVALVNSGGKMYFKWLALEERDVVIYQKPY